MERSIKGTHDEEKKTKEKHEAGITKIPTDVLQNQLSVINHFQEVASPRSDLSPRNQLSSSTPDNVKSSSGTSTNITTGSKKKAGKTGDSGYISGVSVSSSRFLVEPEPPVNYQRHPLMMVVLDPLVNFQRSQPTPGLVMPLPRLLFLQKRLELHLPTFDQVLESFKVTTSSFQRVSDLVDDHGVAPVPFENPQTGIFVYPNPMTTNNPFLDVYVTSFCCLLICLRPAANQNPFATNTFATGNNPYATNSPFAPNPNRMTMDPNMFRNGCMLSICEA